MANKSRSDIIRASFIGNRLDAFRDFFTSIVRSFLSSLPRTRWIKLTKISRTSRLTFC
ncbi:hypothetical protein BDZ45DRAFT_264149 [Acephala macrosclerotiorum]|nr:hypothetical protein BDZ45DRAFT_264149 [Acephala macrosclerotiorum]